MVYPFAFGLSASNADYDFSEWYLQQMAVDFNEYFAITAGRVDRIGGTKFWPANDIETVSCEGSGCESINDWDTSHKW